ncbi:macB-like periplasmic core domain protein [Oceanobacillus picturae]|uniref:MacB-like periplasmic core domain protein n=2 Tax=Oceanobacillus picturae TaxID=171693 RepID=A0A0U9HBD3_9BACI|nr:macB-like periplasmic core domain protein [Oceanobacillus picturae]
MKEGEEMKGRIAVFVIILVTIIAMFLCWLWLQDVIEDYDLERALGGTKVGDYEHNQADSQLS